MTYDAIVVGGGIVGASTAYHLARAGARVALFDRGDEGRATDAGAGIVAPISSGRADDDAWFRFARAAAAYYPELVEDLVADGVAETGYERTGMIRVALSADEVAAFDAAAERIRARAAAVDAEVESISAERAREFVPALADVERAMYLPGTGRVDGRTVTDALLAAGGEYGLERFDVGVDGLLLDDGAVVGVETVEGRYDAGAVVIAGGAWSGAFGDDLGIELPVSPERGQIVHVRASAFAGETGEWPIVNAFGDLYGVSWPGGHVAAGATSEDVGFDAYPTVAGLRSVLDGVERILPGLADARFDEVRVGLRPVSSDGRPILGPVPGVSGAYVATGHGPTGLHLGPYSGRVIAEQVLGRAPGVDVDGFWVERFRGSGPRG